jgi:hypothetical protein
LERRIEVTPAATIRRTLTYLVALRLGLLSGENNGRGKSAEGTSRSDRAAIKKIRLENRGLGYPSLGGAAATRPGKKRSARQEALPAVAVSAAAAATAASTATTTISATASATTAARSSAGASLVNLDSAPLQIGVIEGLDCGRRVGRLDHLDEAETPRLSRELVRHHHRAFHFTRLPEQLRQVLLSNRVGEIAYI